MTSTPARRVFCVGLVGASESLYGLAYCTSSYRATSFRVRQGPWRGGDHCRLSPHWLETRSVALLQESIRRWPAPR